MGVEENLAQTPSPHLGAGRTACLETIFQIADELRAATRTAKILQARQPQRALASKEESPATAFSSL
jgi:hypothetical protein